MLDFFSWHTYTSYPDQIIANACLVRSILDKYGLTKIESHLNKWNYMGIKPGEWQKIWAQGSEYISRDVFEKVKMKKVLHLHTCHIAVPGTGEAFFQINVPGDSRVIIDQVHLRPVGQTHVSQYLHEIGHMTGEMYAAQLREFVPPLRAVYSEARILAIGEFESAGLREEDVTSWRSVVIGKAADLFDTLVVIRYSFGPDNLPLVKSLECVADNVAVKEADLHRQAQSIRDAKLDCTMGIVEWNYWTRASHNDHAGFFEPNDIRHCLYAAGYLNAFCRMGDILEVTNYYSLVNTMGMIHVHDGRVQFSDVVKVFSLYSPALPGEVLELEVDSPPLTGKSKAVDANFICADKATYCFLINYSVNETAEVLVEGFGEITKATGLRADNILTPVEAFQPVFAGRAITLPPMSLVRVCTRKGQ